MVVKEISEITSHFREAAAYPAVSEGSLLFKNERFVTVHSKWSQRDIERKEKVTLKRSHVVDLAGGCDVLSHTDPQEVNNEIWSKSSPSGEFRAVVRSGKDKKNEDKQYLEIYDNIKKLKTVDILALEKHGKIIGDDGQFGTFEWSSSEDRLLYLAEKKKPKTASFFDSKDKKGAGEGDKKSEEEQVLKGFENDYRESWGEQLVERHHPVICVMNVTTGVVTVLDNVDDSLSAGQAMWSPDDAGVVFCAWHHEPYRLGLKHCCQRKGGLFYYDLEKFSVELLSAEGRSARFPRFSPDMSRLVYFDSPVGGAHHQCSRLLMIDWASKSTKVVIDIVRHAPADSFQGIFLANIPRNTWFKDNIHLSFSTAWRSCTSAIIVNTDTGEIKRAKHGIGLTMSVLDVKNTSILLSCSSMTTPNHLILADLKEAGKLEAAKWIYLDGTPESSEWLFSWEVLTHKPTAERVSTINADLDYESILCLPPKQTDGSLPPLIVFVHGGPHVAFDTSYSVMTNFFCMCGYAVLMVNYRGSWGFGQDCIESLLGHIGDMDVKDVESAMQSVLSRVDSDKVFMAGGSHGGYLSTQLIGQYPKAFKAAAVRNPVINLASMYSTTDILDWIFVEGGLPFDHASLADGEKLPELWRRSPMSHVDKVTAAVMLMVGLEDKRVPPSQSMEYYKALKARNVPVRCLVYPNSNHSLAEVDVECDSLINSIVWYNTYL